MALRRGEAPLSVRNEIAAEGYWKRGQCSPQRLSRRIAHPNVRLSGKVGDSQPTAVELPHTNVDPEIEIWVTHLHADILGSAASLPASSVWGRDQLVGNLAAAPTQPPSPAYRAPDVVLSHQAPEALATRSLVEVGEFDQINR
jgi:hypothetical protein